MVSDDQHTSALVGLELRVLDLERRSAPVPPIHTYSAQILPFCGASKRHAHGMQ